LINDIIPLDLKADRQIMSDLMESISEDSLGKCPVCGEEGIILTAVDEPTILGCWVCVKNNKVVNPTGKGFF